jgi:hypothetical protein
MQIYKDLNSNNICFDNKYIKSIIYIILILYASVIAHKLPDYIITYLENPFVKMLLVIIIGFLAIKDQVAAIIGTICIAITYLFISQNKINNYIKKIIINEEINNCNNDNNDY